MSDYPESFDHMLAAWNESEPSAVRSHLEKSLAPKVRFVDPTIDVTGIEGFEANVHDVQGRLPGAVYSRTSRVDSHHRVHRYHWAIHQGDRKVLDGFDVVETDRSGRVICVMGFFGELKAAD